MRMFYTKRLVKTGKYSGSSINSPPKGVAKIVNL
jgi:hypothetical protein